MDGLGRQIEYFIDEFTILQKRQYIILQYSLVLRGFPLRGFLLRGFWNLSEKICITRFYKSLIEIFLTFFGQFFCLYYDFYKDNFDLRDFWVTMATA